MPLVVVSLAELRRHATAASLWVVMDGVIFDATSFVQEHPGGANALVDAGAQDLEAFWKHYPVH